MEAVLDDVGSDDGQFGDLVRLRVEVGALKCRATVLASRGDAVDDLGELLGRHHRSNGSFVPRLSTTLALGGGLGRLAFDVEGVGGGWFGGVLGVGVESGLQRGDLTTKGLNLLQQGCDKSLGLGRCGVPNILR